MESGRYCELISYPCVSSYIDGSHQKARAHPFLGPKTARLLSVWPSPFPLAGMVRLITHNLLACHAKGCTTNNFPLKLTNVKLALREADFNPDFLRGFLPRIEWDALIQASREVTG